MQLRTIVGAGDRIMAAWLPFAVIGVAANVLWPAAFRMGIGAVGKTIGILCLVVGVTLWLASVVQILVLVPRGKLITSGPFALVRHPLYTSVAILVIPGCGLVFDSWLGFALGIILYGSVRVFAPREDAELAARFPQDYPEYRKRVWLPWL